MADLSTTGHIRCTFCLEKKEKKPTKLKTKAKYNWIQYYTIHCTIPFVSGSVITGLAIGLLFNLLSLICPYSAERPYSVLFVNTTLGLFFACVAYLYSPGTEEAWHLFKDTYEMPIIVERIRKAIQVRVNAWGKISRGCSKL